MRWVRYQTSDRGLLEFTAPAFVKEAPAGSLLKGSPEAEAAREVAQAEQDRIWGKSPRTRAKRRKEMRRTGVIPS